MRAHSEILGLRANNEGQLILSVSTDSVKTDVNWSGLSNPTMCTSFVLAPLSLSRLLAHALTVILRHIAAKNRGPTQEPSQVTQTQSDIAVNDVPNVDTKRMYGVLVSIKSFVKFLSSHLVSTTTICCTSVLSIQEVTRISDDSGREQVYAETTA